MNTLPLGQEDSAGLGSLRVDADGIVKMDVDTGLRSTRAEGYIPSLPKLDFAHMRTRHEEITVWTAFRKELTSWLCLLDDRFSEELQEAIESVEAASLFSDPGTFFSKPHAILNFKFFVGVKKKTFVFFLTAICGLEKDCFICKTLHFAFCLDFLICTIFLNLLMCAYLACLFLFCFFKVRPKALSCGFLLIVCGKII